MLGSKKANKFDSLSYYNLLGLKMNIRNKKMPSIKSPNKLNMINESFDYQPDSVLKQKKILLGSSNFNSNLVSLKHSR